MGKLLADIIYRCPVREISGAVERDIIGLAFDSRKLKPGYAFVAVRGTQTDGHLYIDQAVESGAEAVVCESMPENRQPHITYIKVENSAYALAWMASNFYDNPSQKIKLIGVTGTNGKTTIVTLLHQLYQNAGYKTGLFSTIENRMGETRLEATHTTPDPLAMNQLLVSMLEYGCTHAFMEVSSHALVQHRVSGLRFAGGVFTNLTHDHLDYHKSFTAYRDAKKRFFDQLPAAAFSLINTDDRNARYMVQNCPAQVHTYGLARDADFKAKVIENGFEGLVMETEGQQLFTRLSGRFNALNLMAVLGTAILSGLEKEIALPGLSLLGTAEGRFDYERSQNGIVGIVDYAHTPDALKNVLTNINEIRTHNENLITVVGAGGNRDRSKRPKMAEIAANLSDKLILTADNPRYEDPVAIIEEMRKGVPPLHYKKTLAIANRLEAIRTAVALARPGDIILVAGKGHEKYQEIEGVRHLFDDKKELFNLLKTI